MKHPDEKTADEMKIFQITPRANSMVRVVIAHLDLLPSYVMCEQDDSMRGVDCQNPERVFCMSTFVNHEPLPQLLNYFIASSMITYLRE
jgi:hypothetical protein